MSESRSWDIQPRKKVQQPAPVAPAAVPPRRTVRAPQTAPRVQRPQPVPRQVSRREPVPIPYPAAPVIRREKIPQGRERVPLKNTRRRKRRRALTFILTAIFTLIVIIVGCFWLPAFRVEHVDAAGPDMNGMQTVAIQGMRGSYDYLVPKNSIFFFPDTSIRTQILNAYPDIAAVAISRESFDSIAINAIPRESAFLWCGSTFVDEPATPALIIKTATTTASSTSTSLASTTPAAVVPTVPTCYDADSQGFIFDQNQAATSTLVDTLRVYGPLASSTANGTFIGQTVASANYIPNALEFVKLVKSLNVSVVALVLRSDEADLYTQAGTRITYVLGQESAAAELAQSAFSSINLNDGSIQYVDLRFAGKVYYKKTGAANVGASATSTYSSSVNCYLSGNCQIH